MLVVLEKLILEHEIKIKNLNGKNQPNKPNNLTLLIYKEKKSNKNLTNLESNMKTKNQHQKLISPFLLALLVFAGPSHADQYTDQMARQEIQQQQNLRQEQQQYEHEQQLQRDQQEFQRVQQQQYEQQTGSQQMRINRFGLFGVPQ